MRETERLAERAIRLLKQAQSAEHPTPDFQFLPASLTKLQHAHVHHHVRYAKKSVRSESFWVRAGAVTGACSQDARHKRN